MQKIPRLLQAELSRRSSPRSAFPDSSGIGIKPVSKEGTERLFRAAIEYAIANKRKSVTIVHKGNIMKFTEGAFRNWGYELAEREFADQVFTWEQWERIKSAKGEKEANAQMDAAKQAGKILIKDAIADITLQQVLTRPDEFDVIATLNLNGDYLSDALAAQVGGIGIAPGGNINYLTGHAVFEATHGTAPKYANLDKVNPGLGDPVRRDDAALPGLDRGRRRHHRRDGQGHRPEDRDLRFRAPDGGRDRGQVQRVRRHSDPQPVAASDSAVVRVPAVNANGRRRRSRSAGGRRHAALLHDVERGDAIRLGHGRKIEDLLDEELGGRAGRDRRLPEVDEFRGALAEHLNAEHARRSRARR